MTIINDFVEDKVLKNKEAYYISELCELYESNLTEKRVNEGDVTKYRMEKLVKN